MRFSKSLVVLLSPSLDWGLGFGFRFEELGLNPWYRYPLQPLLKSYAAALFVEVPVSRVSCSGRRSRRELKLPSLPMHQQARMVMGLFFRGEASIRTRLGHFELPQASY